MESTTQIYLQITPEGGAVKQGVKKKVEEVADVSGETEAGGYEGRIDITDFNLGLSAKKDTVKAAQKPDVVGNLDWDTVTISKVFDNASLSLAGMLNGHQKFKEATIAVDQQYVAEGEKEHNEVLILVLKAGRLVSFSLRTSEGKQGASMIETVELSFHSFSITYYSYERKKEGEFGNDYRLGRKYFESHRKEQQD